MKQTAFEWVTPVAISPLPKHLQGRYEDAILTLGSCFSERLGTHIQRLGYNVVVNPYGTLYNPLSIAQAIDFLLSPSLPHSSDDLFEHHHLYHSAMHHGTFSAESKEVVMERIAEQWQQGHQQLLKARHLWITFGTTFVYYDQDTNRVVANCHKLPERCFIRRRTSLEQCVEAMEAALARLRTVNPGIHLLFTVSPVRYLRDGLENNALSKSTLRLLCDELCTRFSSDDPFGGGAVYFPSFEIMTDELRDYRFYAQDMVHPSEVATDYIAAKMLSSWADETEQEIRQACTALRKLAQHRPLNLDQREQHQLLVEKKIQQIRNKYPTLEIANIIKP